MFCRCSQVIILRTGPSVGMLMSIRFILICYSNAWLASFILILRLLRLLKQLLLQCGNQMRRCVSLSGAPCSVAFCTKIFVLVRGLFSIAVSKKKFSRKNKFKFYEPRTVSNIRILRKPVRKIESRRHCGNTCRCRRKGIKIKTKWAIRPIQGNRVYFILEFITLKTTTTKLKKQQQHK